MSSDPQLEALVQKLREPLRAYFPAYEDGRDLGRGTSNPTSANVPGGLQDKDRFYRTDLNLGVYYDSASTLWLSQNIYTVHLATHQQFTASATGSIFLIGTSSTDQMIVQMRVATRVATTNNASNYYTVQIEVINFALNASTGVGTFTTATDAVGTNVDHSATFSSSTSGLPYWRINVAKTGTPGTMDVSMTVRYRDIVP